jgi:hypothetical protein
MIFIVIFRKSHNIFPQENNAIFARVFMSSMPSHNEAPPADIAIPRHRHAWQKNIRVISSANCY